MTRRDATGNHRLGEFEAGACVSDRVAGGGQYGDDVGDDDRPVPDDVGEPQEETSDDPDCADCGSTAFVDDASAWSEMLPSKPLCRPCARDHL